jgi:predicted RNase H-like nuclease
MREHSSEGDPVLAGVDGCRAGWLCLTRATGSRIAQARVFSTAVELADAMPAAAVIAWDIPIGLTGAEGRACDLLARRLLGSPRASSVFTAPIRPALGASTQAEATRATRAANGKGVAAQAFGIYSKVAEVDALLRAQPALRERIVEVHPELSFRAWNDGVAFAVSKKRRDGFAARLALVDRHLGDDAFPRIRSQWRKKDVADDDVLDAFAALWTAERLARGDAVSLPDPPPRDAFGLPMRIVY